MPSLLEITSEEVQAGRLLLQLSRDDLARLAELSAMTLVTLESDASLVSVETRERVVTALFMLGVRFRGAGDVSMVRDGRIAPTIKVAGRLHGSRLRVAMHHLGLTVDALAGRARIGPQTLRRMLGGKNLNAKPTLGLYRVVGALQLAGYSFGAWRYASRPGDMLLAPKREPFDRKGDWSPKMIAGWRPPGVSIAGVEDEDEAG